LNNKQPTDNFSPHNKKEDRPSAPREITDPKEIEKAAEFASAATGVRKDFLMGMLAVESDLGRKTGECTYGEVTVGAESSHSNGMLSQRAWSTFQERQHVIKGLAKDLGYDAEKLKVSCNPSGYAGTGGAMGVPLFMPDMWMHYKGQIAAIVGKESPDPWNAKDGVVAMALLLADTPGVTQHNYYAERNSAKMYLSGTTSSAYDWYANQAFYWSKNYAKLLG
jgi:membrane-bound lytic murein transglycosylase B